MPFDATDFETKQLLDLSRPSLAALSHVLRNPELWPANFDWYYGDCTQCALGMAYQLWLNESAEGAIFVIPRGRDMFGISAGISARIFLDAEVEFSGHADCEQSDVTPSRVADLIDAYLAGEVI